MRTLNIIMMVIGIVILGLFGLAVLAIAVYPGWLLVLGDFVSGPLAYVVEGLTGRAVALLIGVVFCGGLVYYGVSSVRSARRERTVVLQNPMGDVLVSLPAIEDFARVLKGKIEGLRDIKGRVVYTRRGLKVTARITIFSDVSIADVTEKVQSEIRTYIQKTLSIDQEISPTVVVTKVVAREKPLPPPSIKHANVVSKGTTELPTKT